MASRRAFLGWTIAFLAGCTSSSRKGVGTERPRRGEPLYVGAARAYVVDVPADELQGALDVYPEALHDGMREGVLALSQRCTHMGCRVPFCSSSGWFECACHAAMFGRTGEARGGPAPRGMDFYILEVDHNGDVVIDTDRRIEGLPLGTKVLSTEPSGPHCVG